MSERPEIAIVGAGPIGIETAVALKKAGIPYLHFDSRQIGYTISWFAPQTRFFSSNERIAIAGVPLFTADQTKSTREEYLAYLRAIVQQFDLQVHTYEPVVKIDRGSNGITLTTSHHGKEFTYVVQKLILATGGTERPRKLHVAGENLPHVSHYFCDPHTYFRKRLLVVGGRNSAVEAALRSHHAGAEVILSYRGAKLDAASIKYWLWPEMNGLMQSNRIQAHLGSRVVEIRPDATVLEMEGGKRIEVAADFVLLLIGYEADMTLFRMAGVDLTKKGEAPKFNPATMETNVPGVYVAGTAVGGTQDHYALFLENCHIHVDRILASLQGRRPPGETTPTFERPES